jgi:hypothetical protein
MMAIFAGKRATTRRSMITHVQDQWFGAVTITVDREGGSVAVAGGRLPETVLHRSPGPLRADIPIGTRDATRLRLTVSGRPDGFVPPGSLGHGVPTAWRPSPKPAPTSSCRSRPSQRAPTSSQINFQADACSPPRSPTPPATSRRRPTRPNWRSLCCDVGSTEAAVRLPYATAKAAVEGLTRTVAVDHGPAGIRANAVALGSINTERYETLLDQQDSQVAERTREQMALLHPPREGQSGPGGGRHGRPFIVRRRQLHHRSRGAGRRGPGSTRTRPRGDLKPSAR